MADDDKNLDLADFTPRTQEAAPRRAPLQIEEEAEPWPSREPRSVPVGVGQGPAPTEMIQLSMRAPRRDVEEFKRLARLGNYSQPQMLRRMLRAYLEHPNKNDLGL